MTSLYLGLIDFDHVTIEVRPGQIELAHQFLLQVLAFIEDPNLSIDRNRSRYYFMQHNPNFWLQIISPKAELSDPSESNKHTSFYTRLCFSVNNPQNAAIEIKAWLDRANVKDYEIREYGEDRWILLPSIFVCTFPLVTKLYKDKLAAINSY